MSNQLLKQLYDFRSDYITYSDLCQLLQVTDNARYALIKRALKEGYLIRLRKGIYRRAKHLSKIKPHPFEMSHYLYWPSYVSMEAALSHHGMIPEAVYNTTCVTFKRACVIENEYGYFSYKKMPRENFFVGVLRNEENENFYYVATPWKAITDYIYCYKKDWRDLAPLEQNLRIELNELPILESDFAKKLSNYYHHDRINRFLKNIIRYYQNEH